MNEKELLKYINSLTEEERGQLKAEAEKTAKMLAECLLNGTASKSELDEALKIAAMAA